ncbi:MAG: DUF3368 domain-containing protein [Acidobacteriota bacterium]|nr:DUF3368 domain-containing protein [Blastocatellia bacterium]MDW8239252.1 DUF3368 domain-containing protein [Acidobacteriota bacterium]
MIVNASPLIYLHRIGCLDLLKNLYGQIVVPAAVEAELREGQRRGADVPDVSTLSWIEVRSLRSSALLPAVTDLGPGEAEVIGLAREHPGSLVIIDDQLARKIAEICGVSLTGTIGVLLKAKQLGYVPAVAPILHALQQVGFWLGEELTRLVLVKAHEESGPSN